MFKELFLAILLATLAVDLIFFQNLLGSAKDKPPDPASSTLVAAGYDATGDLEQAAFASSVPSPSFAGNQRRLFARSSKRLDEPTRDHYDRSNNNNSGGETNSQDLMNNNNAANINNNVGIDVAGDDDNNIDGRETGWPTQLARPKVVATSEQTTTTTPASLPRHRFAMAGERANMDRDPPKTRSKRRLTIRVKSSKSHVLISVNGIVIHESKSELIVRRTTANTNGLSGQQQQQPAAPGNSLGGSSSPNDELSSDGRGLHVVVLNENDGSVMSERVFDTYTPGQDDELAFYLGMISDGRILILAVKDEASFKMAPNSPARKLLRRLGSKLVGKLRWRDMWAFVTRKGRPTLIRTVSEAANPSSTLSSTTTTIATCGQNLAEGLSKSGRFFDWAQPVILDVDLELASQQANDSRWPNIKSDCDLNWRRLDAPSDFARRAKFCSQVEGYGSVCHCSAPAPLSFAAEQIKPTHGWQLSDVPILVIAGNRPYYLHRMLRSLLQASGVNKSNIVVSIDGFYDEPRQVAELYALRVLQHRPVGRRSGRISYHYKQSLGQTFDLLYPEAKFAIIFEEDLDVSRDALIYFNQTLGLLRDDPSLYCASAWNDQGYEHTASDRRKLYRIETMPGLGWLLKRDLFKLELEPNWPQAEQVHDWDMWIRTEAIRKHRECIIPDVSRTFHFGSSGTNINSYFQRQYFNKHAFSLRPLDLGDQFDQLAQLSRDAYERQLEREIGTAKVVVWSPPPPPHSTELNGTELHGATRSSAETVHAHRNASEFLCALASTSPHRLASSLERLAPQPPPAAAALATQTTNDTQTTANKKLAQVIYIKMIETGDFANWLALARCWHIWDLDARGQHKAMWRVHLDGVATFVVGSPASPYSKLKPAQVEPFALLV